MPSDSVRQVTEVECKSVLNKVSSGQMPFRWSINPYRGCEHKCIYCYARRYHEYLDLNAKDDFETKIFVKINAPQILRRELSRPGWHQEWVAVGTAVDPYQPLEGKYKLTRAVLTTLLDFWTPCSIVTKNSMILRDLSLLEKLQDGPGCTVCFSITTIDSKLAQQIEPDTPPPNRRLEVMRELVDHGVHAGVIIAPILPGLTDGPQLEAVVDAAAAYGARFIHTGVLRLEGSVKSVYFDFIDEEAPQLSSTYRRMYPRAYAPRAYRDEIARRVAQAKAVHQPRGGSWIGRYEEYEAPRAVTQWREARLLPHRGGSPSSKPSLQMQLGI